MKVVVTRCARSVTKTDMEREIERLFQENKDLRVEVGHLNDDLNCANARITNLLAANSKWQDQVLEMHDTIQELRNDNAGLEKDFAQKSAECEKMNEECTVALDTIVNCWQDAITERNQAQERAADLNLELMEREERIHQLELRIEWLEAQSKGWENKYNELKAQKDADDEKCQEVCNACNKIYEDIKKERDELRTESNHYKQDAKEWKMTADKLDERVQDLCTQLRDVQVDYDELSNSYDDIQKINQDYAQEIDRLRKVVTDLQTHRFTMGEVQNMICRYLEGVDPSADSLNF